MDIKLGRGRGRGKWKPTQVVSGEQPKLLSKTTSVTVSTITEHASAFVKNKKESNQPTSSLGSVNQASEPSVGPQSSTSGASHKKQSKKVEGKTSGEIIADVPNNMITAAKEFRDDTKLSAEAYQYFFCRMCGSPAGNNMHACFARGHTFCSSCVEELDLFECPLPLGKIGAGPIETCDSSVLANFKSLFRDFLFRKTKVSCINRENGCEIEGPWSEIEAHQPNCPHDK